MASTSSATAMSTRRWALAPTSGRRLRVCRRRARRLRSSRDRHADVRILRRNDDIGAAEQCGVAGEAAARIDADARIRPESLAYCRKVGVSRPATPGHIRVAGPAATASAKQMIGSFHSSAILSRRSFSGGSSNLGAGQHRVVIGHDAQRALFSPKSAALTVPMPVMIPSPACSG